MSLLRPATLRCAVEQRDGAVVIHLAGRLDVDTSPAMRTAFLKCLIDEPDLIVLDLQGAQLEDDLALTMFAALARHAAAWPGAMVGLTGALPAFAEALDRVAGSRQVALYSSSSEAIAQMNEVSGRRRFRQVLKPAPQATATARALVAHACAVWHQLALSDVAQLVITELVSNVLRHAGTEMEVAVALRREHLHLSVRDASFDPPRPGGLNDSMREEGRGLLVIEALAMSWGSMPTENGKVVWATLESTQSGPATRP